MIEANKGWQAEEIKEMYKGCLPFSYMTKPCNHRGSNVTDSKLPECTYEFNSCKGDDGSGSSRRKRSEEESGGCLTEAKGFNYRGPQSKTVSGKIRSSFILQIPFVPIFQPGFLSMHLTENYQCVS